MLIQVCGKGFELSAELRNDVEEKVDASLSRFEDRIGRVNVFLADVNGPKNGLDKSVRIVIDINKLPMVVVEETGELWHATLDLATERAVHSVSRLLDRVRSNNNRRTTSGEIGLLNQSNR